jgi:hypothetical protein
MCVVALGPVGPVVLFASICSVLRVGYVDGVVAVGPIGLIVCFGCTVFWLLVLLASNSQVFHVGHCLC